MSSSKPRAPQTAHLRKAIQKASRQLHRPRRSTKPISYTSASVPPCLNDTTTHCWFAVVPPKASKSVSDAKENFIDRCAQPLPPLFSFWRQNQSDDPSKKLNDANTSCADVTNSGTKVEVKALCQILEQLGEQFKTDGKPYCAMASAAAVRMVQCGKQDDINPGLWPYIRRAEVKNKADNSITASPRSNQN